jgi:hypothetical protein
MGKKGATGVSHCTNSQVSFPVLQRLLDLGVRSHDAPLISHGAPMELAETFDGIKVPQVSLP